MLKRRMCLTGVVLGFVASAAIAGEQPKPVAIGDKAPDFGLTSSDGQMVSLANHTDKVVVLEWTNHQCPVVGRYVAKQRIMQNTAAQFKDKDVVWLAVDSSHHCLDNKNTINEFRKKHGLSYPTLLDPDGKVGHLFGAKTTPHMFVIDRNGILAYSGSLDDDRYGGSDNPRNYVAEAVTALLKGSAVAASKTKPFGCSVKYKK